MERGRERSRNPWLYQLCVLSIGIPINRGGDLIQVDIDLPKKEPGVKPEIPVRHSYYPNSIEEYRNLLNLANRKGSRTGLAKRKKSAEAGIKFLQYSRTQIEFMEFLSRFDEITYNRVILYSNPSILKIPFRSKESVIPDPRTDIQSPIAQIPGESE
jgi:hypothetical protein